MSASWFALRGASSLLVQPWQYCVTALDKGTTITIMRRLILVSELNPDKASYGIMGIYALAWADFQRFVKGWSPEHWKINEYTE